MCSGKVIGSLGFSRRGVFIGEGASSGVDRGGLTHRGRGPAPGRTALVCGVPRGPTPSPLWFSGSFGEILLDWLWFHPIPRIIPV
jgi:hypothetical protein